MLRALSLGVALRCLIVVAELIGYWFYESASLMLEAISTGADLCSSFFLIACVWLADRHPDEDHPLGHGRYEPLGGLQLGLLIGVFGIILAWQELSNLWGGVEHTQLSDPVYLIPLAAVGVLEFGYRSLMRTAKSQKSSALAADALHFRIDALTSIVATLALLFASFSPAWSGILDHAGALTIALCMLVVGVQAVWENLHQIMDRRPDESFF
ncbi:MAG: cation diffusion facilitator family transporter, partial [Chlamydiia bacterium]|nr:cation diffusion facilitator family transporter [Chlamydiia bacterium]